MTGERALERLLAIEQSGVLDRDDERKAGYAEMVDVIRDYLGARYRVATHDLTTAELMRALARGRARPTSVAMVDGWLDELRPREVRRPARDRRRGRHGARRCARADRGDDGRRRAHRAAVRRPGGRVTSAGAQVPAPARIACAGSPRALMPWLLRRRARCARDRR